MRARHACGVQLRRPSLRRERDTRSSLAVAVVGGVALLVAIAALVLRTGRWTWQPAVIGAALAHQLMWAAPVAFVLLLAVRRWFAGLLALVALVLVVLVEAPLYIGGDVPGGRHLTVLQANLKIGAANPQDLIDSVRRDHVDVLMTEELTTAEEQRLVAAGLPALLPHRFSAPLTDGGGGLAIWSRFPLTDTVDHGGYSLGVLTARARIGTRDVALAAVHLLPPYPYPPHEWLDEIERLGPLLARVGPAGVPVIVGGDFNATTDNAQFRRLLANGYEDAAEHAGAGYLVSYPTDRFFGPIIAIDHVLTRGAAASDASTVALPGSDHRGLLVRLALPR